MIIFGLERRLALIEAKDMRHRVLVNYGISQQTDSFRKDTWLVKLRLVIEARFMMQVALQHRPTKQNFFHAHFVHVVRRDLVAVNYKKDMLTVKYFGEHRLQLNKSVTH